MIGGLYIPLVAAAWALTAARSRLNALSATPFSSILSLASRRWMGDRRAGERSWRARRRPIRCEFMMALAWDRADRELGRVVVVGDMK
jgi:hypothetical protein